MTPAILANFINLTIGKSIKNKNKKQLFLITFKAGCINEGRSGMMACQKFIRKGLLQAHEQFSLWEDHAKLAKESRR